MKFKVAVAGLFSALFVALSLSLAGVSAYQFISSLFVATQDELIAGFIHAINTAFISLATFELGISIGKEYAAEEESEDIYYAVRRTITRFVGVVCIALVLEGLIMVIKYSQLDMAGNLYYPVAIIAAASMLLVAQGVFIHLTRRDCHAEPARDPLSQTYAPYPQHAPAEPAQTAP